jgi:ABC-2 type transport system permease protein
MANLLTILVLGIWVFSVPFQGNFWLFLWLAFMYIFSGLGLGILISTISQNQKQVQQISMMVMLLAVILSGFMFPRDKMNVFIRLAGNLFPLTYFIPIARGIISKGIGIASLWEQLIAMCIYGIVIMIAATRAFRRGLE